MLVFPNLTYLDIRSIFLDIITSLLRSTRLPAIKTLYVNTSGYISRRAIQAYWDAVREACPSNVLTCFQLYGAIQEGNDVPLNDEVLPCLALEDLHPCTAFSELRELSVDFDCPVSLTDADLLQLISSRMENFLINRDRGWRVDVDGGGITLSGLVQLLRQCPSLNNLCLAIDTRTFTEIPEGLDVSFLVQRPLKINLADSYILPEFIPGLVSVFAAMLKMWTIEWNSVRREEFLPLWKQVLGGLRDVS